MKKDIMDYWAFPFDPRPNQIKALKWLQNSTAQYKLLEAPVGSGKSNIAITYSMYRGQLGKNRGNAYILTPQRILQEQYETSMEDIKEIKLMSLYGRSNYECTRKNTTCDLGSLITKPKCTSCAYQLAKNEAMRSPNAVMNYTLAALLFLHGGDVVKQRNLIVMDECHNVEDTLISFDAVKITYSTCKKYKIPYKNQRDIPSATKWVKSIYLPQIQSVVDNMRSTVEPLYEKKSLTKNQKSKIREFNSLVDHVDSVFETYMLNEEYLITNFVLSFDPTMFELKRLYGAHAFHRIIEPMAKEFLFMSSTILNKTGFCEDLNLPSDQTDFMSLESEFPEENRPVFYIPHMKMNASWNNSEKKNSRKKYIEGLKKLLDLHKDDSGVIHTGNFQISDWIVDQISSDKNIRHKIYHHGPDTGDDRNSVISAYLNDPRPSVLVSPSSTEGLDLKEDLGRFAIIAKVPFGYLGDQWIKNRMNISSTWYQRKALIDIIQGGGRIVRSEDDWGNVYILDESFAYLFSQASHMIPKWWKDSYQRL